MRSLVVVALLAGCGSKPELLGDGGVIDAPSRASLSVEPPSAEIGSLQTQMFTVKNEGSDPTGAIVLEIMGENSLDFLITQPTCTILTAATSCTVGVYSFGRVPDAKAQLHAFDSSNASDVSAMADLTSSGDALAISVPQIPNTPNGGSTVVTAVVSNPTTMASGPLQLLFSDPQFSRANNAAMPDSCSGASLASGDMCSFPLQFQPEGDPEDSDRSTTVTAMGSMVSGNTIVMAKVVPLISVDSTAFTGSALSCASPMQGAVFTYKNETGAPLTNLTYVLSGGNTTEFSVHNSCSPMLGGGQTCQITVSASSPSVTGTRTTTLVVTGVQGNVNDTVSSTVDITFSCDFLVSPSGLSFSMTATGTTTQSKAITISNTSTTLSHPIATMLQGLNPSQFTVMDPCNGTTLGPGSTCVIMVSYHPTAVGVASAALIVSTPNRAAYNVSLSGTGFASLTFTPPGGSFMTTAPTSMSPPIAFTLRSTVPTGPITVSTTGPFAIIGSDCASLSDAMAQCTVNVVFVPTVIGTGVGTLTAMAATGVATATLAGDALAQIAVSPSYTTLVSNSGALSQTQTFTVSNLSGAVTGPISIQQLDPTAAGFVISSGCTGVVLLVGSTQKCTFTVTYQSSNGQGASTMIAVHATPGGDAYALLTGQAVP